MWFIYCEGTAMQEELGKLGYEFEKWKIKYNIENYMDGNVFHYTSAIALENIFRNNTLWVTKSDFLNDKTEYMYAIKLVNRVFEENKYKYLDKNTMAQINRDFKSYLARSFIFSTSRNNDSVNLWSNYSEHEGYNIGFNLKKIFKRMWDAEIYVTDNKTNKDESLIKHFIPRKDGYKSIEMSPGEVIYEPKIQENTIRDILGFLEHISEMYHSYFNNNNLDKQDMNHIGNACDYYFRSAIRIMVNQIKLFKNPVFAQDEEYRIIFDVNNAIDVKKYRQFKGVFIPYIEVVFDKSNDIKKLPADSITIGPKNNLDIAAKGLSGFLKSQGYKVSFKPECKDMSKILIKDSDVPLRY